MGLQADWAATAITGADADAVLGLSSLLVSGGLRQTAVNPGAMIEYLLVLPYSLLTNWFLVFVRVLDCLTSSIL